MRVVILTYGASIHSVVVPDRDGRFADVALGHATLAEYVDQPQYIGSTVGRVANRIAGGRFVLDGRNIRCRQQRPNSLHGGAKASTPRLARGRASRGAQRLPGSRQSRRRPGLSCDNDGHATYSLDDGNALSVEYEATVDTATLANLSNHAYWNLAGEGAAEGAMGHRVTILADHYLPTDDSAIPTGQVEPVENTPLRLQERPDRRR
jgi:aldose 1-epimerase